MSIEKAKRMVVRNSLSEEELAPVQVAGEEIEMMEHFPYLGSVISRNEDVMEDVKRRIVKAPRALNLAIFNLQ